MLDSLSSSLRGIVKKVKGTSLIDEEQVNSMIEDLEAALIESDVNVDLVLTMTERVRELALQEKLPPAVARTDFIIKVIHDELINLLGKKHVDWNPDPSKVNKLMFIGVQGSGKTTVIGKEEVWYQLL